MVMLTYQLPDAIREIAMGGEYNEFDLRPLLDEPLHAYFANSSGIPK